MLQRGQNIVTEVGSKGYNISSIRFYQRPIRENTKTAAKSIGSCQLRHTTPDQHPIQCLLKAKKGGKRRRWQLDFYVLFETGRDTRVQNMVCQ